ncbi:MAG: ABC transporter permease [Butyrivibrio sp.]|nr:ABC transporter permease [Butyrivibrio sp.]
MGVFGEYIKSALASIGNNKGRSFLTMLGIIIGISSVLIVLTIGDGMKAQVNTEIDSVGAASIKVSLDTNKTDKYFSKDQMDQIEDNLDDILGLSPSFTVYGTLMGRKGSSDVVLTGVSESYSNAGSLKMLHGRYFTKNDVDESRMVLVISKSFAKNIFGYENVVGREIEITSANNKTVEFTVLGVRDDNTMDTMYGSFAEEPTVMAEAPYTALAACYEYNLDRMFTEFNVYLDKENREKVLAKTRAIVENICELRGEKAVKISSGMGFDAVTNQILDIITTVVALIAAISLLVGGIGVMNIMTVSVTERTREIGIRKSLGARTASILTQFLAEASILTFTGGIIGLILGLSIAKLITIIVEIPFMVNPLLVVAVVAVSTSIGLFFGIYPAKRAADLDPIEALRTE